MPVRRQKATRVDEATIAQLRVVEGLPDPENGQQADMTEAELALLQIKGLDVQMFNSFEVANPDTVEKGALLFKVGHGDSVFSGRVINESGDDEKVFVWRYNDGIMRAIPRSQLVYLTSIRRVSPSPIPGLSDIVRPMFPCPSKLSIPRCEKQLFSLGDAHDHMHRAHMTEYKQQERERDIRREEKMDNLLDLASRGGENNQLAALVLLMEEMKADRIGAREAAAS